MRGTVFLALFIPVLGACSGSTKDDTGGGVVDTGADTGTGLDAVCEQPTEPGCIDEMILDLSLHDDKVSDGKVETVVDGEDFVTEIDASAGGYNQAADNPWVYVRFDPDGAHRVDIDDETALEDMTWDLALHRFIIRENSGDSGPSCVGAAFMDGTTYDDLTEIPAGQTYLPDDFYDGQCEIQDDGSGLPGSPAVAVWGWWVYDGCLQMSRTPYLIQKMDGHVFKLMVDAYYKGSGQEECDSTGSTSKDGGFYVIRWRMMN